MGSQNTTCPVCGDSFRSVATHIMNRSILDDQAHKSFHELCFRRVENHFKTSFPWSDLINASDFPFNQGWINGAIRSLGLDDRCKCLVCGEQMRRISNTHLARHGLSMKEYQSKFPLSKMVTKEVTKCRVEKEVRLVRGRQHGNLVLDKQLTKYPAEPSPEEWSIIVGTLLGDGYLQEGKQRPESTYLCMEHGVLQIPYLLWKAAKLERWNANFRHSERNDKVVGRVTCWNIVTTGCHRLFGSLSKEFYTPTAKKLPSDEIFSKLGPLGLAVWYMDDGSFNGKCELCTHCFTKEENERLVVWFKENYDVKFRVVREFFKNEAFALVAETLEDSRKFISIVKPHIHPLFAYKIGEVSNKCQVTKVFSFDSAHFLEDHPGKCYYLHGGRWNLHVTIEGPICPETGMVIDYTYLKQIVDKLIIEKFDHRCINYEVESLQWRSTTELMCRWIWDTLIEFLPGLYELKLYETPDSYCVYRGESLRENRKACRENLEERVVEVDHGINIH